MTAPWCRRERKSRHLVSERCPTASPKVLSESVPLPREQWPVRVPWERMYRTVRLAREKAPRQSTVPGKDESATNRHRAQLVGFPERAAQKRRRFDPQYRQHPLWPQTLSALATPRRLKWSDESRVMQGVALAPFRCSEAKTRPAALTRSALRTPRPHMEQSVQPQGKGQLEGIQRLAPAPVRVPVPQGRTRLERSSR